MLRVATVGDLPFIQDLAGAVFSRFGDYRRILTRFFYTDGVTTFIWEEENSPAGLGMVALDWGLNSTYGVADLMAIALTPDRQGQGSGGRLLAALLEWSRAQGADEMQLTVAEPNHIARRFFARHGFAPAGRDEGRYPAGQRALRMVRTL